MSVEAFLFWGIDKEMLIVEGGSECKITAVAGDRGSGVRKRCADATRRNIHHRCNPHSNNI